jgi:amidohydrolase
MKKIIDLRRQIHAQPEISGEETRTAQLVASTLRGYQPDILVEKIGKTGVLAIFKGQKQGKNLLFRAELDGLPIAEINSTLPWASTIEGKGHLCGHDGHTAILLATAIKLKDRNFSGTVSFIFQPAEETGRGAQQVLEDPQFLAHFPDEIIAIHNLPGFELGTLLYKNNYFTASVRSIAFRFIGKTAHAAEPENGNNPALIIAKLIQSVHQINVPNTAAENFCIATFIHATIGTLAYGVSAGWGEAHFTCRSWKPEVLEKCCATMVKLATKYAKQANIKVEYQYIECFEACLNNDTIVQKGVNAATVLGMKCTEVAQAFKWGEDFGQFTKQIPGAMFGIGAGETHPSLHHPDYDFPDDLIDIVSDFFIKIVELSA